MYSFLQNTIFQLKKNKLYFLSYFFVLCTIHFNFIIFYLQINHPIHSPFVTIGPSLFTLINSIIFSLTFFFSKSLNRYFFAYLFLLDILLVVNTVYFHYYGNVIPFYSYGNVSNLTELQSSIFGYFNILDFIYFLPTSILLILSIFFQNIFSHSASIKVKISIIASLITVCIFIITINLIQDKIKKTTFEEKFYNRNDDQPGFVSYYGILPLWTYQIISHIYSDRTPLSTQEKNQITLFTNTQNKSFQEFNTKNKDKNLIIIIVESLDSWVLKYANGQATPFLNKIMQDSNTIFVRNVLPQINQGRSSDAQLIINTGLLPVFNNTVASLYSQQKYPSLAQALKKTHYSLTIMGNKSTSWNQKTMNLIFHIDTLISIENLNKNEIIGMGISDRSVFEQTANILVKTKQPFYCQIITLSSHDGIDFKNQKSNLFFPKSYSKETIGYIKSIEYVDKSIEYFISESPLITTNFQKVEKCIILGFLFIIILIANTDTIICIL